MADGVALLAAKVPQRQLAADTFDALSSAISTPAAARAIQEPLEMVVSFLVSTGGATTRLDVGDMTIEKYAVDVLMMDRDADAFRSATMRTVCLAHVQHLNNLLKVKLAAGGGDVFAGCATDYKEDLAPHEADAVRAFGKAVGDKRGLVCELLQDLLLSYCLDGKNTIAASSCLYENLGQCVLPGDDDYTSLDECAWYTSAGEGSGVGRVTMRKAVEVWRLLDSVGGE